MEEDGPAAFHVRPHQYVELVFGADVDAACRIEQEEDTAFGEEPFGDRDLLLIAARERFDRRPQGASIDFDTLESFRNSLPLACALYEPQTAEPFDHWQRSIMS